jgi:polyisoprenoid-binding protein YceI
MLVASCAVAPTVPPETVPAATAAQATNPRDLQGAQLYRIDPAASTVNILVYRGGSMAKIGHNHVISSTSLAGFIWQHATLDRSGFNLVVPVNELIIDDEHARAAQGEDFPGKIPDEAKQGTRNNMLGKTQLDGALFPFITINSVSISGAMDVPQVKAMLQIKNQTHEVALPVKMEVRGQQVRDQQARGQQAGGQQLAVSGEFEVKQSDFGITPFSVAMGALFVLDSVKVRFDLVAVQIQP